MTQVSCRLRIYLVCCLFAQLSSAEYDGVSPKSRIAVIGGGIGGTFVTKYMVDYNKDLCTLDAIDIFDPTPELGRVLPLDEKQGDWQGSRVANIRLKDGRVVEVGASVGHSAFRYILDMLKSDPRNLTTGEPFYTGEKENLRDGLGIYDGEGGWPLLTSNQSSFQTKKQMLWRYHFDLLKTSREATQAEHYFQAIHDKVDNDFAQFETPDDIWKAVNLDEFAHESFDAFLNGIFFLSKYLDFWRSSEFLRKELLTAINLCNYNQNNAQVNALVGLASFGTATVGKLFSIKGGNGQVIDSAYRQAQANYARQCQQDASESPIRHVSQRVTKVVARSSGGAMDLYGADNTLLGTYDIVVLAAPIQMSRITFLQQSHVDELVVTPMPLTGMVKPITSRVAKEINHQGHDVLPPDLPDFAKRPYSQVVTTVVSSGDLNTAFLQLPSGRQPRSILVTEPGKAALFNITAISQITGDGVYKIFSNEMLEPEVLTTLFGPNVHVEFAKVWGGPHGGATPDFQGQGKSLSFTLFRGGMDHRSVLFYVNAMEGAFSCMENTAIGAKAVAKLVAGELKWIEVPVPEVEQDEL